MGDTGSLAIGAIIAVLALAVRKEFLLPIIAGIFLVENLSVIIQVSYFKYTKKKYGEGKRVFLMSPLHHHYQKKNYPETKIVTRFGSWASCSPLRHCHLEIEITLEHALPTYCHFRSRRKRHGCDAICLKTWRARILERIRYP